MKSGQKPITKTIKSEKTAQTNGQDNFDIVKQELDETKNKFLRAVADYQNLEKRLEKERQDWIKFANTNLLLRVIDIADHLDRAANFIKDPGLTMVRDQMNALLKEFGVTEIEAVGKPFDPQTMECVDKQPGENNIVLQVQQKGYLLYDKVLKPAKVIVGQKQS